MDISHGGPYNLSETKKNDIVIASEAKQSSVTKKGLDCFVAPAQNCSAILSRAPRNDELPTLLAPDNHQQRNGPPEKTVPQRAFLGHGLAPYSRHGEDPDLSPKTQ
jgi:hypothetical protein